MGKKNYLVLIEYLKKKNFLKTIIFLLNRWIIILTCCFRKFLSYIRCVTDS